MYPGPQHHVNAPQLRVQHAESPEQDANDIVQLDWMRV